MWYERSLLTSQKLFCSAKQNIVHTIRIFRFSVLVSSVYFKSSMRITSFRILRFLLIVLLGYVGFWGGMSSCISPKSIIYFQGDTSSYIVDSIKYKYYPTIQSGDILSVVVSSLNTETNELLNFPNQFNTPMLSFGAAAGGTRQQPIGYLVNNEGEIEMPLIGKLRLVGLSSREAADVVRERLHEFVKEPTVTIRTLNFRISVIGEVKNPAVYVIPDEKINLNEALAMAGDLTIFGRRTNVLVIRENNGIREYARVDLTSRDVFNSPYYYMHKDDVVYIEPIPTRMNAADRVLQLTPLFVSLVSAITLIVVRFR